MSEERRRIYSTHRDESGRRWHNVAMDNLRLAGAVCTLATFIAVPTVSIVKVSLKSTIQDVVSSKLKPVEMQFDKRLSAVDQRLSADLKELDAKKVGTIQFSDHLRVAQERKSDQADQLRQMNEKIDKLTTLIVNYIQSQKSR